MPDGASAQHEARDVDSETEWREPPGWLGEAVRRAKQIPHNSKSPAPPP